MVYEKKFPICPYKGKGNKKCSHKGCGKICIYSKPEKCNLYNEWVETRDYTIEEELSKIEPINPPQTYISNGASN